MNTNYSLNEQKSILKILDFLINADDFIHIQEVDYLTEIIEYYNFQKGILLELDTVDLTKSFKCIENMDSEKQKIFVNIAQGQAQADNKIAKEEKEFLQYLKKKII